jgi:hypothetical protein
MDADTFRALLVILDHVDPNKASDEISDAWHCNSSKSKSCRSCSILDESGVKTVISYLPVVPSAPQTEASGPF